MDHFMILLVGLDGFKFFLDFNDHPPIRVDAKCTFEEHLAVLGENTCVSIGEVLGIGHRCPGKRCCLSCALTDAIGPPRGHTTIEVGSAVVGATLMPDEEPDIAVAAVTIPVVIVIVSLTVTPSVTVSVLIVVLSLSMSSESPVAVVVDVSALCRCRAAVASTIPPCPPKPSLVAVASRSLPSCPLLLWRRVGIACRCCS